MQQGESLPNRTEIGEGIALILKFQVLVAERSRLVEAREGGALAICGVGLWLRRFGFGRRALFTPLDYWLRRWLLVVGVCEGIVVSLGAHGWLSGWLDCVQGSAMTVVGVGMVSSPMVISTQARPR